ncbi:MAG: hypothetical protein COV74_02065 [Candidatus Omnitrophica bacterium CG11_big_fil_rev_8_21_14_0_20_45_26]|uniref:Bacterial surface antigen (D15) domain-containing protein n=1 Tax=Candidatus Abzuiibacterium crystallinum TaxID=1974748 RepID=A0A2H0LRQ0_9BACT|nr:MAG: hypothetical protein COV74_02065 [Candidatus Omnitrophica bacterium CG11_big_fil_rev_8_21_14_0_20_45_26]PIW63309.1 MAG: hypothetical protein COW12_10885 [Candidatus Omnitrophica bacterium CG12_big_fil_rev_8_21_14_0_65_45_16]
MKPFASKQIAVFSCATVLIGFIFIPMANSANESYDRYSTQYPEIAEEPAWKEIVNHALVYPFEILRGIADGGLYLVENYQLDQKAKWIYGKIQDQGITPFGSVLSFTNLGGGAETDLVKLAHLRAHFPSLIVTHTLLWNHRTIFETSAKIGAERLFMDGVHAYGNFKYESRPEEHFNGIGHLSTAGNGTSYKMEVTTLGATAGYSPTPLSSIDFDFTYQNINITDGEDGGRGIIDTTFPANAIPGLAGDDLITVGLTFDHDTRHHAEASTQGGQEKLSVAFVNGIAGSNARYFKSKLEISRYLRLGSDRRVLAFHFYGEQNNSFSAHSVPFHQMARLGGYGDYPNLSQTLRGFDNNRFYDKSAALFNLEYRYTVWEHREFKLDTVVFLDEGQVFNKYFRFKLKNFRESYGIGTRLSFANNTIFSVEVAHGDEGTNFYVKSRAPF